MSLSHRTNLGPYEIHSRLGAGGMGEVYLALDTRLNRRVALKVLPADLIDDREHLHRFKQEAQAASALNHPNIITIYEIGAVDGTDFIAVEFIEGETLRKRLQTTPIAIEEALNIATQTAGALDAAHRSGIVHRDIKPENIMIRHDGIVKVLDFGIAKLVERPPIYSEATTAMETKPGVVMGTLAYMSPEQARGLPVDERTDIFSFGVLFYEMLVGRLPFAGETASDRAALLRSAAHPPDGERGIPVELERIVAKTLAMRCEERYQSAKELLIDLQPLNKRLEFQAALERASSGKETELQIFQTEARNSIAVLPFANLSNDPENEYFCDGLAEELLNALAKIEKLKVAARTSSFSFKGKNINVGEIGRALSVQTVLEGSVRKSGNRLRITVQLVEALSGYHLWSERYDREMQEIFELQDEIALAVVNALKVKLFGDEESAVLKRYTDNTEAYHLYLKGRYYWFKATPDDVRASREFFQRAIDLDPTYALGYVGLGDSYGYPAATGMIPPDEGWRKEEAALARALELDETLPEVHSSMAALNLFYYRDWAGTEREVKRAIELNPNYAEVHCFYPYYLVAMGRFDEAIAEAKRGLELDPLSPRNMRWLGEWFYHARRYDEAIQQYHEALELDPNNLMVHEDLGNAYEQKGLHGEAVAAWQKAMTLAGDHELAEILHDAYAESGFSVAVRAVTEKRLEQLKQRSNRGEYVPKMDFVRAYVRLERQEQAFHWLEKASEERNMFALLINSDPFYDSLKTDPRFENLLLRIGLVS